VTIRTPPQVAPVPGGSWEAARDLADLIDAGTGCLQREIAVRPVVRDLAAADLPVAADVLAVPVHVDRVVELAIAHGGLTHGSALDLELDSRLVHRPHVVATALPNRLEEARLRESVCETDGPHLLVGARDPVVPPGSRVEMVVASRQRGDPPTVGENLLIAALTRGRADGWIGMIDAGNVFAAGPELVSEDVVGRHAPASP
jgi:hypothetical protein